MNCRKAFIVFVLCALITGCTKTHLYFVKDAKIGTGRQYDEDVREDAIKLLEGHYLEDGRSTVLLIRKWNPGNIFAVDDEQFFKITVQIDAYEIGEPISLNSSNIAFNMTEGSSVWAIRGLGWYAKDASGVLVVLEEKGSQLTAHLEITANAVAADSFLGSDPKQVQIKETYIFKRIKIEELTPWLGTPGDNVWDELYPN